MKKVTKFGLPVIIRHDNKEPRDKNLEKFIKASVDFCLENIPLRKGKMIDVGSSYGFAAYLFKQKGWKVEAIDLYPPKKTLVPVKVIDWNKLNIHYKPEFDLVFINHGLEHAESAYNLLRNLAGITKKGGYLFIACPHASYRWAWDIKDSTTHFSLISPEFLETAAKRFGFKVLKNELRCFRDNKVEIFFLAKKINNKTYDKSGHNDKWWA